MAQDVDEVCGILTEPTELKRLYADFNDFAVDGSLPFTCKGSIDSIAELDDDLSNGEQIVLSDGEMEVIARLVRRDDGSWEARSDWRFAEVVPCRSGA